MRRIGLALAVVLAVCSTGASCASNPVKTAAAAPESIRPELLAFALYGSFVVVAERAADIAEAPTTPEAVKTHIKRLYDAAEPAARRLKAVSRAYTDIKAAADSSEGGLAKFDAALAELNKQLNVSAEPIGDFAEFVGSGP